jgi:hypothetical protein
MRFKTMSRPTLGLLVSAVLVAAGGVVAVPAQASTNLGTFTYDCNNPVDVTIVGAPGDTATVDSVNCPAVPIGVRGFSPPLVVSDFTIVGGLWYLNPTTITLPSSFTFQFLVSWQYGGTSGPFYGIKLTIASGGGGASSQAPAPSGHPFVRQGLPMPASGSCEDIEDEEFAWGTGLSGGWAPSWSTWRRDSGEVFYEGPTCIRVMEHADGRWRFADRRHY